VQYNPSIGYAYLDPRNSFYNGTSSSVQFIVDDKGGKEDVRDVIWAYVRWASLVTEARRKEAREGQDEGRLWKTKLMVRSGKIKVV
jgi:hypothetical protein